MNKYEYIIYIGLVIAVVLDPVLGIAISTTGAIGADTNKQEVKINGPYINST